MTLTLVDASDSGDPFVASERSSTLMSMGGYQHHLLLNRPVPEARLWRYIEFAKFVDMLDRSALYFARADRMLDTWEGDMLPRSADAHLARTEAQSAPLPAGYALLPPATPEDLQRHLREMRRRVYLSCWYSDDDESARMWDEYAGQKGRGVAIQSTFERLEQALPADFDHTIYASTVQYYDPATELVPRESTLYPFVHKWRDFRHEREVRALLDVHAAEGDSTPQFGLSVPVNLSVLMERVYIAPHAPGWLADLVERLVKRYGIACPVVPSALMRGLEPD